MIKKIWNLFWDIIDCFVATASDDPESYMEEGGNSGRSEITTSCKR